MSIENQKKQFGFKEEESKQITWSFKDKVSILNVLDDNIVLSNGLIIESCHDQDCCEQVYADWESVSKQLKELTPTYDIIIKTVMNMGFLFNGVLVNCYNEQNGYYSDDLYLNLKSDIDGEDKCVFSSFNVSIVFDGEILDNYESDINDNMHLSQIPLDKITRELCEIAIDKDASNFKYVPGKFITQPLCFMVVKKSYINLKYVPEKFITKDICEMAINENGFALSDVPEKFKTYELCKMALSKPFASFNDVPEKFKTYEMCEIAMNTQNGSLKDIPENLKTMAMCELAVTGNGWELEFVPEELKTKELCLIAVKRNSIALGFCPEKIRKDIESE